ncbi:MAG: aspartyl protease [Firmicutes bacterium]|nr:aspartyl protease [Bacillota bacterium]
MNNRGKVSGIGKDPIIMGMTYVKGTAVSSSGKSASIRFLVDSGATYTLLPFKEWKAIGLKPKRVMEFSLADGTRMERKISECYIKLPQGEGHTPVILGEPGDEALLGVITLENLGLILNPFSRQLQPMKMLLARVLS